MKIIRNAAVLNLFLSLAIQNVASFSVSNPPIQSTPSVVTSTTNTKLQMSTFKENISSSSSSPMNDFNGVPVAKTGGRGAVSASQEALQNNLSLGAPGDRPKGGHFLTRGGVQITAQVNDLLFVNSDNDDNGTSNLPENSSGKAIEDLINRLDSERGVLLSSSYEFPGRYVVIFFRREKERDKQTHKYTHRMCDI